MVIRVTGHDVQVTESKRRSEQLLSTGELSRGATARRGVGLGDQQGVMVHAPPALPLLRLELRVRGFLGAGQAHRRLPSSCHQ